LKEQIEDRNLGLEGKINVLELSDEDEKKMKRYEWNMKDFLDTIKDPT
jgi:hypothetical protein